MENGKAKIMPRFYIYEKISAETASITDADQLHHLRDVLRLKPGDSVTVFDIDGNEFLTEISSLDRKQAALKILSRNPAKPSKTKITIACAVPKKAKMDDVIDKLTQLGVDEIVPLETERSIVKLAENELSRRERWQKIAINAAEQSRRNTLPVIYPVLSMEKMLAQAAEYDLKLIPTLYGDSQTLNAALADRKPSRILALIGPEGDFTPQEVEKALNSGFIPVSLGHTVLRVETAAIALAAYLKLAFSD